MPITYNMCKIAFDERNDGGSTQLLMGTSPPLTEAEKDSVLGHCKLTIKSLAGNFMLGNMVFMARLADPNVVNECTTQYYTCVCMPRPPGLPPSPPPRR